MTSLANAFEPSICAAARGRAEHRDPRVAERVGDPGDQRRLRPDDDQVDPELGRASVGDGVAGSSGSTACSVATAADARVAGGGMHLGDRGVAGERPGQGVLAAAGADDEDLHGRDPHRRASSRQIRSWTTTVCVAPGPTPTAEIRAPDISSSACT